MGRSLSILLDLGNMGIAVGITLLTSIQVEINIIHYQLPVYGSHLRFTSDPDLEEYSHQSYSVTGYRKCGGSRWNPVAISYTS